MREETISIDDQTFKKFKTLMIKDSQKAVGHNPRRWAKWIASNSSSCKDLHYLPDHKITRKYLYEMIDNSEKDTKSCVLSILAWGGMRRNHAAMALAGMENWLDICEKLRACKLNRKEAYTSLQEQRAKGNLKGMGPAYFTKLIFFLMHGQKNPGYIMDQWTATSVNLLAGRKIVETNKTLSSNGRLSETVSDHNTEENYDCFCRVIETIADKGNTESEIVEISMFSEGGREKGKWRKYLIDNRLK